MRWRHFRSPPALWLTGLVAALAVALFSASASAAASAAAADSASPDAASSREEQEIDLQSETLTVDHKRQRAVFGGGVVVRRGDLEVRCPTLVANYDHASKIQNVVCEGPVTATQGGTTMTSQAGTFDNTSGLLQLDGETTLVEADRKFSGESLTFETGSNLATLVRGRAEIPAEDPLAIGQGGGLGSGPFRITADEVQHDFAARKTTFRGNVVGTRADLVIKAARLVLIGAEGGQVERAWTEGGKVYVTQGARSGVSDRAHFAGGGQRLVLEGNPVVTENGSSLRGDKVTFFVGQGRVEVAKPRAVFPLGEARRRTQ